MVYTAEKSTFKGTFPSIKTSSLLIEESSESTEYLSSLDYAFSPKNRRYLECDYKKTRYKIKKIIPVENAKNKIKVTASVIYPENSSIKAEDDRKDIHLSTIDILFLGNRICESIFSLSGSNPNSANSIWLEKIDMDLGNQPIVQLYNLDFTIEYLETMSLTPDSYVFRMKIGKASVDFYYHCHLPDRNVVLKNIDVADLLKSAIDEQLKPFGDQYKNRDLEINHAAFRRKGQDVAKSSISANLKVIQAPFDQSTNTVYSTSLSVLDLMLAGAQMSKALIYKMDDVNYNRTRNWWIRSFSAYGLPKMNSLNVNVTVAVQKTTLLKKNGKTFRVADLLMTIYEFPNYGIHGNFVLELD